MRFFHVDEQLWPEAEGSFDKLPVFTRLRLQIIFFFFWLFLLHKFDFRSVFYESLDTTEALYFWRESFYCSFNATKLFGFVNIFLRDVQNFYIIDGGRPMAVINSTASRNSNIAIGMFKKNNYLFTKSSQMRCFCSPRWQWHEWENGSWDHAQLHTWLHSLVILFDGVQWTDETNRT